MVAIQIDLCLNDYIVLLILDSLSGSQLMYIYADSRIEKHNDGDDDDGGDGGGDGGDGDGGDGDGGDGTRQTILLEAAENRRKDKGL